MNDIRDAFAALFGKAKGVDFASLPNNEKRALRKWGDAALHLVEEHREALFYAYGLSPDDGTEAVLQAIRRQHIAIGRAIEKRPEVHSSHTVSFACPRCGRQLSVERTSPYEPLRCPCGCLISSGA